MRWIIDHMFVQDGPYEYSRCMESVRRRCRRIIRLVVLADETGEECHIDKVHSLASELVDVIMTPTNDPCRETLRVSMKSSEEQVNFILSLGLIVEGR